MDSLKCDKCNKNATIFLKTFQSCNSCFIEIIDKRIKKEIRLSNSFKKNIDIFLINDKSNNSKLIIYFFKKYFQKNYSLNSLNINKYENQNEITQLDKIKFFIKEVNKYFRKNNLKKEKKLKKKIIILPWNLDNEINSFLESIFYKKNLRYKSNFLYRKFYFLKPLLHISNEEIEIYLKLKKIKFKVNKKENDLLKNLSKENPEIKFALLKSELEL